MTQDDTHGTVRKGNTKLSARSRAYCFTINNYKVNIFDTLTQTFEKECQYIFGKEIGEKGTKHIQGYIKFKNARSFASIKKLLPKAHIEKAKGSVKQNYVYCSKEKNFISNIDLRTFREKMVSRILVYEYDEVKWKDWQQEVLDILERPADPRKIHWFWEKTGNVGKSYLCKYIAMKHDVIIASGKKADVFNQINTCIEKKIQPKVILLDIPRDEIEYTNWGAVEMIKNGLIYSGKYEGGQCIFPIPTIIAFANSKPPLGKLSRDRWDVHKIVKSIP